MAYPDQDVEVTLEAAFGADLTSAPSTWMFTDLSSRLIQAPITITQGVVVGTGTSRTASATGILCLNDDGALTPESELSPYWPYVDAGTPARLSIRTNTTPYLSDAFTGRTSSAGWGTSDSGRPWVGSSTVFTVASGTGKVTFPAANQTGVQRINYAHRDVQVTWDMSIATVSTGASNLLGPTLRSDLAMTNYLWPEVEFAVGGAILWTVRKVVGGVTTSITQVTQPGLTYAAGTVIRNRAVLRGDRLLCKSWLASGTEPTAWTIDLTLTDSALLGTAAYLGMQAWIVAGNSNTLPNPITVDNVTFEQPKYPRIEGYLSNVEPVFWVESDGTPRSQARLSIGGIGSRLEKLSADDQSPMARSLLKASTAPTALWTCEDGKEATSAASAFPDQPPMNTVGPVVFDFDVADLGVTDDEILSRYGTTAMCSLAAGAKLVGAVPFTTQAAWTVAFEQASYVPTVGGGITEIRLLEWLTPSTYPNRWALVETTTSYEVRAYNDSTFTTTLVCSWPTVYVGLSNLSVTGKQNGSNVECSLLINANSVATGTVAGTISMPTRIAVNPDQANTTNSTDPAGILFLAGQVVVYTAAAPVVVLPYYVDATLGTLPRADRAWAYEAAHRRLKRLSDEERVQLRVLGDPYTTGVTRLNAQQPGAFKTLIAQAADSESGGLLYEGEFGYIHDPRTNRYNRRVTLTVDMSTYKYGRGINPTDVLVPKLDARGPNQWTVQRRRGSQATAGADASFRARRGTIADKAELDILYDADAAPHAQWRTHLNVDGRGANYPAMTLDLAANPELVDDYLLLTIGSRLQRTNQPTISGYGTIDQVVDGLSETITPKQASGPAWTATVDTSPATVWNTGVWDSATSLWQPDNTVLSSGVTTTAVSWSMNSNGQPWQTGAVSLRAQLGREIVLITNISGSGSAWTFTVTRSVNGVVTAHTAGAEKLSLLDAGTWGL